VRWAEGRARIFYLGPVADEEPDDVGVALRGGQVEGGAATLVRGVQLLGAPLELVEVSEPGGALQLGQRLGVHLVAGRLVEAALETQVAHRHHVRGAAAALAALAALHEADHPLHAPPCIALVAPSLHTQRAHHSNAISPFSKSQSIFFTRRKMSTFFKFCVPLKITFTACLVVYLALVFRCVEIFSEKPLEISTKTDGILAFLVQKVTYFQNTSYF
jgi:hypothetical protein